MIGNCICVTAYTMDANEAQEEYEEVQTELRKKEEEVSCVLSFVVDVIQGGSERKWGILLYCIISALTLLFGCQEGHPACKKRGMVEVGTG